MAIGDLYSDSDSVHVDGNPTKVSGSKKIAGRDPSTLVNWWKLRPVREVHLEPPPVDVNGVPMRLCSGGHYAPIRDYARNPARRDKLDNFCKSCRKVMTHNWRAEQAEEAGRVLRKQAGRPPLHG